MMGMRIRLGAVSFLAAVLVAGAAAAGMPGPVAEVFATSNGGARHAPAVADSIWIAITPTDTVVTPGGTFDLHLRVTQAGKNFNAYDAVIAYDPAALTFVPRTRAQQEGSLMRGACNNTFYVFSAAGDSLSISHSLLCSGITLTGPGILFNLRFQASATPQLTAVTVRSIQFYDAGVFTGPVSITNSRTQVGVVDDVVPPATMEQGLRLRISPNPFNPTTTIHVQAGSSWHDLSVLDVRGRRVRLLAAGPFGPGEAQWIWDGRDDRGARVASGVYVVSITGRGMSSSQRIVLLE
jgi:FlgD Ig-like domain/Cohesin domain